MAQNAMATEQILNSYAVVILDLLPVQRRIKYAENPADLLPMIKKAIKKFIHDKEVATTADEFGITIDKNLGYPSEFSVSYNDIMKSYKTTILMLESQEVKEASGFFYDLIDVIIRDVSVKFAKNYTNANLGDFRIGGISPIRTQILDELTRIANDIRPNSIVPTGKTRAGGRSRYNKRSNKRSVYRRRRSSKRQSRKVSKARSTRRK